MDSNKQPATNMAQNKIGPMVSLSDEQQQLVDSIMAFIQQHIAESQPAVYTIFGDAGTGKSVVLSHLFEQIQTLSRSRSLPHSALSGTHNYLLVNHPEVLKVYKAIAGTRSMLLKKDYQRPTSFINQMDQQHANADIVLIDEAHLLLSKSDHYNRFYHNNQLTEIIKRARIVILVFDQTQVLRTKSFWTTERLQRLLAPYPQQSYQLQRQFRMTAPQGLLNWFNHLTIDRQVVDLPAINRKQYDFRIFEDAEEMRQAVVRRNNESGLARVLSTSGYPSVLDGGQHYITEGRFKMPWDQYNYTNTPWAELPTTIDEVGSIYTCQGFDLNYAGIIIGPPIYLADKRTHRLDVDLSKHTDAEAFKKRDDITDPHQIDAMKKQLVMNSLNVLLKRGIYGTYLYAHDPQLRELLLSIQG